MPTMLVVVLDKIIVFNDVGKVIPGITPVREDGLLAITWDGEHGQTIYKDRREAFDDAAQLNPWIALWEAEPGIEVPP